VQEINIDEARHRTPVTQVQHEGNQADVDEKESGKESVETEVWFEREHPSLYRSRGLDCCTTHLAQASKNLKLDRRRSPPF
jgi:hypothetical protein